MRAGAGLAESSSAELLDRYDVPGPRYTSYPTAASFTSAVDAMVYQEHLSRAAEELSLYVHLPFCRHRCSFCACHVVITRNEEVASGYLARLEREVARVAEELAGPAGPAGPARQARRRRLTQYHWGGGTPTFYDVESMERLHRAVEDNFDIAAGAECAIEVDPRVTTTEQLAALREWGFNRVSLGVQDIDPHVQEAIGRVQSLEQTAVLIDECRALKYESVNVDLIYGLPAQSLASFRNTLDAVAALGPDRLAVYSFALVPWMKPHQKRIQMELLPGRDTRLALLGEAYARLTEAGYVRIGMDHFALPDDELVRSQQSGHLNRNFMGYTVARAPDLIGVGVSAISDVAGAFFQNHKRLHSYLSDIDADRLPVERGYVRSTDDEIRRYVIIELMCNLRVRWDAVRDRFGVNPVRYFANELARIQAPESRLSELVRVRNDGLALTETGAFFPRNVAMVFDTYLSSQQGDGQRFSRTI